MKVKVLCSNLLHKRRIYLKGAELELDDKLAKENIVSGSVEEVKPVQVIKPIAKLIIKPEISPKVIAEKPKQLTEKEIRAKAKEAGIKNYWNKKLDALKKELGVK